ncbi:MAG: acetyl/propionyl/methylcrotonyl-CoA carboxylase subunit alpha [Alphaproteobacteria bacterium]|nr:acetyl/propionyl/methylcrotonyl-CoA carboxylase subunit alpha [Alphaproteobacteria bacterium]
MFDTLLIANRGEIAVRVARTVRRMGLWTIAVYSDADANALHVASCDEAYPIGAASPRESYLRADRILDAAKKSGAGAIHPGYGFLSENADFAEACAKAGIVFVGPPASAIRAMGGKSEAKALMVKAGVPVVPGYHGVIQDGALLAEEAAKIGFPVLIKASAGGGGKGMRIAHNDAEAREGFRSATNEAKSAFGDDRVFVEKFVEEPRHIEIQVIGDSHGNIVHLGERECSIQRRHQKVIEEAPSPFLDAKTRAAMGAQAVTLAKTVKYKSAGTVEFIVDKRKNFYFLEMNTRLQVEHPVTECVTGVDLVELMIRVAAGEKLPFEQKDVKLTGWALEARVYAEDPVRNFLPSIGRLTRCAAPTTKPGIRVDTGVYEGAEISMYYDPMIAKLVAYGESRVQATQRMADALDAYVVRGVGHNIPFLAALVHHPRFKAGRLTTGFIAEEFPGGFKGRVVDVDLRRVLVALAAVAQRRIRERETGISGQLKGHEAKIEAEFVVRLAGEDTAAKVEFADGAYRVTSGGETSVVTTDWQPGRVLMEATVDGAALSAQVERNGAGFLLAHGGTNLPVLVLPPRVAKLRKLMPEKRAADTSKFLLSPMPGLLKTLPLQAGQEVKAGDELCVVEAMKMENILRAERDGKIAKLHAAAGDSLAVDQKIVEFE